MVRKPIFLDRDGVINEDINPYVLHESQLTIFPWALPSLKMLHDAGFDIYIISNQQGIAKGMMSESDLDKISQKIQNLLRPHGFQIAKFYYATAHSSENHHWRKPEAGMLYAARDEFNIQLKDAFFIGDKDTDVQCALQAGCRPLLVYSGVTKEGETLFWKYQPEADFPSLFEATLYVLEKSNNHQPSLTSLEKD